MEGVEFRKAHSAMLVGRVSWACERRKFVQRPVFGGESFRRPDRRSDALTDLCSWLSLRYSTASQWTPDAARQVE